MAHLIDKDALIAEIERRRRDWRYGSSIEAKFKREECDDILSFLDTIEVKEVEEEPVSEDFEEALAREWQGYNDRGAATVDALEDNTQELTFSKGFYRGWKHSRKESISEDLEEASAEYAATGEILANGKEMIDFQKQKAFKAGAKWQKEQMMKETVAEQECKCMQIMHRIIGGSWNLTCPTDKMGLKDGDKVKIKIIKED